MATVVGGNKVKLNNGQVINAQIGGWYDGQQFWNGTLSNPGDFNTQNTQPGQQGSAYVAPKDQPFINQQRQTMGLPVTPQPAMQPMPNTQPAMPTPGMPATTGFNQPTIDLPAIYQRLFDASPVKATQEQFDTITQQIEEKQLAYNNALAKINDNPFYSEATRVGRIAKLNEMFNNDVKALTGQQSNLQNKIATARADIETQLNLQSKQFDIQSDQAQQALNQFNALLEMGAFDSASGEEIANITRATGLSSNLIQSAITANKKKNTKTQIVQIDDGTNVNAVVIDADTGQVINSSVLGASKPKETKSSADDKLEAGNFTNAHVTKAVKILAEADVISNPDDRGDKLLSVEEQQQALLKIQSEIVADPDKAYALLQKAFETGGFGGWTP